jgi:uncharacterized Zn finger protein
LEQEKMPKLKKFTVISYCDDQEESYADWVEAESAEKAKDDPIVMDRKGYAIVITVISGHHRIL